MRLLLDTNVLIWWARSERLSSAASIAIASAETEIFVSAVSIWEAEIKASQGKLELGRNLADEVELHGFIPLAIRFEHASKAANLPFHHRDPFDRMLVAQATVEELVLATRDAELESYGVPLLVA